MGNPLKIPPPDDPIECITVLAHDLAYGVQQGLWSDQISVLRGGSEIWMTSVQGPYTVDDYLAEKWAKNHPSIDQLVAHGYLRLTSKMPSGQENYVITEKANELVLISKPDKDPRKVFVVHGRNLKVRDALFRFLKSIGLHPIEWEEAVRETGEGSPHNWNVLKSGFLRPQAVVILKTPDDEARLRPQYLGQREPDYEKLTTPQPRQNVLFEQGMALALFPKETIIVEVGYIRPFSDTIERNVIKLTDKPKEWQTLALRLKSLGCIPVNLEKADWSVLEGFITPDITQSFEIRSQETGNPWSKVHSAFWLHGDLIFAQLVIANPEIPGPEAINLAWKKLRNAYEHACSLGLENSRSSEELLGLRDEASSHPQEYWTDQAREQFKKRIVNVLGMFEDEFEKLNTYSD